MEAKPADQKRDSYIDFLKGIAMIMVVVGHSVSGTHKADVLFNFIYSFHMPLLFFCSSYIEELYGAKYVGREGVMLRRRIGGLLFPYLSWSVIGAALSGRLWKIGMNGFLFELLGYKQSGLWFLPVLFGLKAMHILYWIARRRTKRNTFLVNMALCLGMEIIIGLLAVLTRHPYIVNMLSYTIPYFFAVIAVECREIEKLLHSEWLVAGAMFVYVLLFPYFSFYDTGWVTQILRIGMSLCVIVVCLKGKECQSKDRIYDMTCFYGRNSLAVYVLHGFLLDYKGCFDRMDSAFMIGALAVVMAVLVSTVCIMAARCIEISSWWKKVLLGK